MFKTIKIIFKTILVLFSLTFILATFCFIISPNNNTNNRKVNTDHYNNNPIIEVVKEQENIEYNNTSSINDKLLVELFK